MMDDHGEWQEKEGFSRLREALENCMWRNKDLEDESKPKVNESISEERSNKEQPAIKDSQNSQATEQTTSDLSKPKHQKKHQTSDNIFALMGMALNNSSPPKPKTTAESFNFSQTDQQIPNTSENPKKEVAPSKIAAPPPHEDLEDENKFKEVDDFTKMFQKINSFKENRSNMTDQQRKDQATKIMMDLMKGFGEDISQEDLEKL